MIFTQTYIQMMKESPIQKEWEPKSGDWYWFNNKRWGYISKLTIIQRGSIWLPTSDDWWEMIEEFKPILLNQMEFSFYILVNSNEQYLRVTSFDDIVKHYRGDSIPELLSAFYHFERWGMRWEQNKWT